MIASADSFQGKDGITEIGFTENSVVVPMRHKHRSLPMMHGNSFFRFNGKQYQWKKHQELIDEASGKTLATFEHIQDDPDGKIGKIVIMGEDRENVDVWVVTCLIDQERGDEGRNAKA